MSNAIAIPEHYIKPLDWYLVLLSTIDLYILDTGPENEIGTAKD